MVHLQLSLVTIMSECAARADDAAVADDAKEKGGIYHLLLPC
jgi:hypothetical protein